MKKLPISKDAQIAALLDGTIYRLLQAHGAPKFVNLQDYVDVSRSDLENVLRETPQLAAEYLRRIEPLQGSADVLRIDRQGTNYCVAQRTNNGAQVFPHVFDSLSDAVAAYLTWFYALQDRSGEPPGL